MLEKFRKAKLPEIVELIGREKSGTMPKPLRDARPGFAASLLAGPALIPAVIAEYKRASPSSGDINLGAAPEEVARAYAAAGARAVSVLTEEAYFKGSLEYVALAATSGLPVLRKDFILHPLQVDATAATRASAVLLIVRMLEDSLLPELLDRCRQHNLEAVVEVFGTEDLRRAQNAGASIIQVNNRDLDTLVTDFTVSRELIKARRSGECWITASGIHSGSELRELLDLGYDAALVGSSIMAGVDPGAGLALLIRDGATGGVGHV